jgi:hypothetical protein
VQARFDVSETLAIGQLGEGHAEELIETEEVLDLAVAAVSADTRLEAAQRQEVHDLREQSSSGVQGLILQNRQNNQPAAANENEIDAGPL